MARKIYRHMRYLILFFVATAFVACQSESAQEVPMYADFFVRYLETEEQIKAHASFYEGDTLTTSKSVTFDDEVTFQNNVMQPRQIMENRNFRYVYNGKGDYSDTFTFKFPKSTGFGKRAYTVAMAPIEDFSVKNGVVSLSEGMVLEIQGEPFQANESLVLLFTGEHNVSVAAEFEGPFDVAELDVPAVQLLGVEPGKNALYLVKKQVNADKADNMDVTSSVEFYSKIIDVEVVE